MSRRTGAAGTLVVLGGLGVHEVRRHWWPPALGDLVARAGGLVLAEAEEWQREGFRRTASWERFGLRCEALLLGVLTLGGQQLIR